MPSIKPLCVIQISDLHLKAEPGSRLWGMNVDEGLNAVLEKIRRHCPQPNLIIATGDLVGDDPQAYPRLRVILESLETNVFCLPGNHDFPAAMARVFQGGLVRMERYWTIGCWQFVMLDSSYPGVSAGHLALGELALLDTVLATRPELHTLVFLHHNPLPVGSVWIDPMTVTNGEVLFAVLDRYTQVRAVAWGHMHSEYSFHRGSMQLLATPSTCVQFKLDSPEPRTDDLPPGYRWFELYPDGHWKTGVERVEFATNSNLTRRVPV